LGFCARKLIYFFYGNDVIKNKNGDKMKNIKFVISTMLVILLLAAPMTTIVPAKQITMAQTTQELKQKNTINDILGGIKKRLVLGIVIGGPDYEITDIQADQTQDHPESKQTTYIGNVVITGRLGPNSLGIASSFLAFFLVFAVARLGISPFILPGAYGLEEGSFTITADQAEVTYVQYVDNPDDPDNQMPGQTILCRKAKLSQ